MWHTAFPLSTVGSSFWWLHVRGVLSRGLLLISGLVETRCFHTKSIYNEKYSENVQVAYCVNYRCITGYCCRTKRIFSDCCRDMRYLLCGVETAKRFVKVHFLCNVRNLKRMSKMSMFLPGKFSADAHALQQRYFQCKLRTVGNFYVLLYIHHKYNASSRTNHRDAKHLLLFTVVQEKSK